MNHHLDTAVIVVVRFVRHSPLRFVIHRPSGIVQKRTNLPNSSHSPHFQDVLHHPTCSVLDRTSPLPQWLHLHLPTLFQLHILQSIVGQSV